MRHLAERLLVALPAYNEGDHLAKCLNQLSAIINVDHILVVSDGSTDDTADIARTLGVTVIEHKINRGKGEAIRSAISFALTHKFQWIVFLDADGQHPLDALPLFIELINNGDVDFILANRQNRSKVMPVHRQLSNGITSLIISLLIGQRIWDSQCGYRAVALNVIKSVDFHERGFQLESEMLIKCGKQGATFAHVPIQTIYNNASSSIHPFRDTINFINLVFKSLWW